jgi:hypothetical protein
MTGIWLFLSIAFFQSNTEEFHEKGYTAFGSPALFACPESRALKRANRHRNLDTIGREPQQKPEITGWRRIQIFILQFLANLFPDRLRWASAVFARGQPLRFQNHRLPFQVIRQGMARTATFALGRSLCPGVVLLGVLLGGILEHILADRRLSTHTPIGAGPAVRMPGGAWHRRQPRLDWAPRGQDHPPRSHALPRHPTHLPPATHRFC